MGIIKFTNDLGWFMKKAEVFQAMDELLRNQIPNVLMGMRLADKIEIFPEATNEEQKLQWFLSVSQGRSFSQNKEEYKSWLFLKGFEDIHRAIEETFKRMLIYKLNIDGANSNKRVDSIRSLGYADLLKEVVNSFDHSFSHKDKFDSLNKIRNTLVHAHGFVEKRRCNNEDKTALLFYGGRGLLFWQDGDGKRIPMEIGKASPQNTALMMTEERFQISFLIGEKINLSLSQFVDVFWTCMFIRSELETILDSLNIIES